MRYVVVLLDSKTNICYTAVVEAPTPETALEAAEAVYKDCLSLVALDRNDLLELLDDLAGIPDAIYDDGKVC